MKKITVEHLKYKYPMTDQLVLDDLSFEIEQGELIGIIGRSGSGKSTLCQALAGLVPHFYRGSYGGLVEVAGLTVLDNSVSDISQRVGMVFQDPFNQITGAKLTVYEEIAFGLENLGIPRDEMRARVDAAISLLHLEGVKNQNPFDLSGGQMQRMAIAGIIAMKPEIIVLDEPTSQLDPMGSNEVFESILSLKREGITIVLVEHKMEKISEYCDKIILLDKGRLVCFDTPDTIFSIPNLDAYGVLPPVYTRICKRLNCESIPSIKRQSIQNNANSPDPSVLTPVIQINNLRFSYTPGNEILRNVSLSIDNRSTAIIGQNGAGKTTLVSLLKGLLRPSHGQIKIKGNDIANTSAAALAKTIGLVFQNPNNQIFKKTVWDEVLFGPLNIKMPLAKAEENALSALKILGLEQKVNENPHDLTLSEKKLLCIASIVAMDTDIIILDEPAIAQDQFGLSKIKKMLALLKQQNKLIIAIAHDMDFVAENFERTVVMSCGKVISDGDTAFVFSQDEVLRRACVEMPYISKLGQELGFSDIILTEEDLVAGLTAQPPA